MSDEPLTRRQREVLDFIKACWGRGWIPTLREIAATFSVSKSAAQFHVDALIDKGQLEKREGGAIRLVIRERSEA